MEMSASQLSRELCKRFLNFDREYMKICTNNNSAEKLTLEKNLVSKTIEESLIDMKIPNVEPKVKAVVNDINGNIFLEIDYGMWRMSQNAQPIAGDDEIDGNKSTPKSTDNAVPDQVWSDSLKIDQKVLTSLPTFSHKRKRENFHTRSMDDAIVDSGVYSDLDDTVPPKDKRQKRSESVDGQAFQCEFCSCHFASQKYLFYHQLKKHFEKHPFRCSICERGFNSQSDTDEHEKERKCSPWLECDVCEHKAWDKYGLTVHKRTHTGEKPFKCDNCDFTTKFSGNLEKHLETVHKAVRK
ncbi:zinc finger protein 684-like [Contarinia nasturtii]|uniref:zinc finger protein 684-like n=1 Tax=Contarinia nasturtii TaxID=265458 RepID=UPI0012D3C8CE|nr:zinc finger protein 684-like [Contarinia nasturtii]